MGRHQSCWRSTACKGTTALEVNLEARSEGVWSSPSLATSSCHQSRTSTRVSNLCLSTKALALATRPPSLLRQPTSSTLHQSKTSNKWARRHKVPLAIKAPSVQPISPATCKKELISKSRQALSECSSRNTMRWQASLIELSLKHSSVNLKLK